MKSTKKWTKKKVEEYVEQNGGETYGLLDVFPFTNENQERIQNAYNDEENYTDSDVCDLIMELALKQVA